MLPILTKDEIVIGKVTLVTESLVCVKVVATIKELLPYSQQSVLLKEDMRRFETQQLFPFDLFAPGDIVRAKTKCISEMGQVQLTTVGDDFGVVASSDYAGNRLIPVSWTTMKGSDGTIYTKKVAKIKLSA